jgi:hypothetical protein
MEKYGLNDFPELSIEDMDSQTPVAHFRTVTPIMAEHILTNRHPKNRKMKPSKIAQLVGDMREGNFKMNGEAIIFANDGTLIDGQHRLRAVVTTNTAIVTNCAFGLDPKMIATIDQGSARILGDVLGMEGYANANEVASVARSMIGFENSEGRTTTGTGRFSRAEIGEVVIVHPKIVDSVSWAKGMSVYLRSGNLNASVIGFCHYVLTERYDQEMVEDFLSRVVIGTDLSIGDPAFAVRRRLANPDIHTNQDKIEIIFRGWGNRVRGKKMTSVPLQGELPRLPSAKHMAGMKKAQEAGYAPGGNLKKTH